MHTYSLLQGEKFGPGSATDMNTFKVMKCGMKMWMTLADLVQSAAAKHKRLWYVSNKLLLVGSDIMLHVQSCLVIDIRVVYLVENATIIRVLILK